MTINVTKMKTNYYIKEKMKKEIEKKQISVRIKTVNEKEIKDCRK